MGGHGKAQGWSTQRSAKVLHTVRICAETTPPAGETTAAEWAATATSAKPAPTAAKTFGKSV